MSKAASKRSKEFRILGPLEYDDRLGPGIYNDQRRWCSAIHDLRQKKIRDFRKVVDDFRKQQMIEPVQFDAGADTLWAYRNKAVLHDVLPFTFFGSLDSEEILLRVKHCVVQEEAAIEKIRREVQAFENFEKLSQTRREQISQADRMFVWQRDGGKCTECGSRENLEYDHILPVSRRGSNSRRNIRLLCEFCNRKKGDNL